MVHWAGLSEEGTGCLGRMHCQIMTGWKMTELHCQQKRNVSRQLCILGKCPLATLTKVKILINCIAVLFNIVHLKFYHHCKIII